MAPSLAPSTRWRGHGDRPSPFRRRTGTPPLVYRRFLGTFPGSSDGRPSSLPLASGSRQVTSSLQLGGSSARRTLPLCVCRWRGCWSAQTSDAWWHPSLSEGLNRLRNGGVPGSGVKVRAQPWGLRRTSACPQGQRTSASSLQDLSTSHSSLRKVFSAGFYKQFCTRPSSCCCQGLSRGVGGWNVSSQ